MYIIKVRARDGEGRGGERMDIKEEQERMTDILRRYKALKDRSHDTTSCFPENNEEAIRLLKEKNRILEQMSKSIPDPKEVFKIAEQACKDAGLHKPLRQ